MGQETSKAGKLQKRACNGRGMCYKGSVRQEREVRIMQANAASFAFEKVSDVLVTENNKIKIEFFNLGKNAISCPVLQQKYKDFIFDLVEFNEKVVNELFDKNCNKEKDFEVFWNCDIGRYKDFIGKTFETTIFGRKARYYFDITYERFTWKIMRDYEKFITQVIIFEDRDENFYDVCTVSRILDKKKGNCYIVECFKVGEDKFANNDYVSNIAAYSYTCNINSNTATTTVPKLSVCIKKSRKLRDSKIMVKDLAMVKGSLGFTYMTIDSNCYDYNYDVNEAVKCFYNRMRFWVFANGEVKKLLVDTLQSKIDNLFDMNFNMSEEEKNTLLAKI